MARDGAILSGMSAPDDRPLPPERRARLVQAAADIQEAQEAFRAVQAELIHALAPADDPCPWWHQDPSPWLYAMWWTPPAAAPAVSSPSNERPLLTLEEAAKRLHCSVDALYALRDAGKLPFIVLTDKIVRIDPADIDTLKAANKKFHYRRYPPRVKTRRR